ncbi:hypothetical protein LY10_03740 [Planktotalea frisia]|uniref:Uncharacterized protein n=1 Tax=Planktotalea frisia TaxID=696762 RepID=A0A1L9P2T7_9RHOB|nr:hypothetical protein PFRI_00250 [Planktotalea frisia]PZX21007.1 hypothetical protein LY10_03740 [Planktotalea frisia]
MLMRPCLKWPQSQKMIDLEAPKELTTSNVHDLMRPAELHGDQDLLRKA